MSKRTQSTSTQMPSTRIRAFQTTIITMALSFLGINVVRVGAITREKANSSRSFGAALTVLPILVHHAIQSTAKIVTTLSLQRRNNWDCTISRVWDMH